MTSEIATIKFSGGAEEGSSSDESSEGFEVTTQLVRSLTVFICFT